ncbi:MAG: ATPase, T2SS/T4P/T4SS family [Acidobacteriota bacterium]
MPGSNVTVSVCAGAGGTGRTLVATNLAAGLHQQRGGRTLLVDAHYPLPGDAALQLGLERTKSLADLTPIVSRLTPELLGTYLITSGSGITVLPYVTSYLQHRLLTPELIRSVLEVARVAYDTVVVDLPTEGTGALQAVLDQTDVTCVVVELSPSGGLRARNTMDLLRALQFPLERVIGCANRVTDERALGSERPAALGGLPIRAVLPEEPRGVREAASRRQPIVLADPRHAISREIDRLCRDLLTTSTRQLAGGERDVDPHDLEGVIRKLKLSLHSRLVDEIDIKKADFDLARDEVRMQELRTRVEAKILTLLEEEGRQIRDRQLRRRIVKAALDEALGLGPLEDLLNDPTITEIMVNKFDQIYVEKSGKLTLSDARFMNAEQVRGVIERIVAPLGRRIDEKVPMVDARLRDGSRVNAIIPPLALRGPAITIRKFSKKLLGTKELVEYGSLTAQMATLLEAAVKSRQNIVISGGTGSGKTTLLNVLSSFIPTDERIITVEDAAELQLPQAHVVALETRPANIEGEGAITIRDLVRNALRMRPDRVVVGECRGGEALDMLQAMNTGHDGSLTTVHANTPRDALSRLETLALMSGLELPARAIRDQIASAIQIIVQQSRLQDGSRRITHITALTGQEDGVFTTADIFVFQQLGLAPDGKVQGRFVPTGFVPPFVEGLARRGIKVPREIFLPQSA